MKNGVLVKHFYTTKLIREEGSKPCSVGNLPTLRLMPLIMRLAANDKGNQMSNSLVSNLNIVKNELRADGARQSSKVVEEAIKEIDRLGNDADRYLKFVEYLISDRTDLDDIFVSCLSKHDFNSILDTI